MKFVITLDNNEVSEMMRDYVRKSLQEKMGVTEEQANKIVASIDYRFSGGYDPEVVGIDITAVIEEADKETPASSKKRKG